MNKKHILINKLNISYDMRGQFFESFRKKNFSKIDFVQDNISYSKKGVIRGMHFQLKYPQAKLLTIIDGEILDIIIDLRKKSNTFMKLFSFKLSSNKLNQLFIPRGFAHGFQCTSKSAIIMYKTDNYYVPNDQHGINPLDKELKIKWPLKKKIINEKDQSLPNLSDFKNFF